MRKNITINTDYYKITHHLQRPQGLNKLISYGEARKGGKYPIINFFGLQPIIMDEFTRVPTKEEIQEGYDESFLTSGNTSFFPKDVWEKVMELGYLPLRIKSAPEGTWIEEGNVLFTIESTEPWFANMVSHFEDSLMHFWKPTCVSTRSGLIKKAISPYFEKTSDVGEFVLPVAVNDFGLRGASSYDDAVISGMAHLVHFRGSDNMPASMNIKDYYKHQGRALSVWATEHSVATVYGSGQGEFDYTKAQLERSNPKDIISIVIDSYDSDNYIQNVIGSEEIKNIIINRPGRVVFRPDSGVPVKNAVKYSEMISSIFGLGYNTKGYKTISNNVGLIQGDGMDENSIPALYDEYTKFGWAADNIITGSGGGLLVEGLTRDTIRAAIKASYAEIDGKPVNVQKSPKTDMTKASKSGILKLHRVGKSSFTTIESSKETPQQFNGYVDSMRVVFENGNVFSDTFDNIIERSNS